MKKINLNTILLLNCLILLGVCAYGIFSRPSLKQIDERMQMWGQHYGTHFSAVNQAAPDISVDEPGEVLKEESH